MLCHFGGHFRKAFHIPLTSDRRVVRRDIFLPPRPPTSRTILQPPSIAERVRPLAAEKGDVVAVIAGDIRHRVPRPWRWPNILDLSPSLIVPGPGIVHAGQPEAITAEEDGDEAVRRQRMADARSRTCVGDLQPLMPIPLPGVAWCWTDTNSPEKQHAARYSSKFGTQPRRRTGVGDLDPVCTIPFPSVGEGHVRRLARNLAAAEKDHPTAAGIARHGGALPGRGASISELDPVLSVPSPSVTKIDALVLCCAVRSAEEQYPLTGGVVGHAMIGARCRTSVCDLNPEPAIPLPCVATGLPVDEAAEQDKPATPGIEGDVVIGARRRAHVLFLDPQ